MVDSDAFSIQGQVLDTGSEDVLLLGRYVCLATCPIRSRTCVVKAMEVDYQSITQYPQTYDSAFTMYHIGLIINSIDNAIFSNIICD